MLELKHIDKAQADRFLTLQEGHFLDVKRVEIAPSKLTESISAFANTSGGELFIGIGENDDKSRFWRGFNTMEDGNGLFQVLDRLTPLSNHYQANWFTTDGYPGFLLYILVLKTRAIIHATDGNAYRRVNAQNIRVKGAEDMRQLQLDKGVITFEDDAVNTSVQDITNSNSIIKFLLEVVPTAEPEEWLRKQNLFADDKPTVAGVLLYSDEPQAALPKRSAVKIYRYGSRDEEGSREQLMFDPITIEGCIYDQIFAAVQKTKELVQDVRALSETGLVQVSYPHETLHEIVTNAVLHRDYSIASDIHVRIFDNRIEVESPGRLPGHVTPANILNEQSARNPKIVRLIHKFPNPPNKDVGEGLNTAFEAMKRLRLREPEIEERPHSVLVHIRHTRLATPHDTVMAYLDGNSEITNRKARELTGIKSENSMKTVFLSLKQRNLIEPVPGKEQGGGSAWRKVRPAARENLLFGDSD